MVQYLLPRWQQFRTWSLPSKYGLYGLLLSIAPIFASILSVQDKPKRSEQLGGVEDELERSFRCMEEVSYLKHLKSPCWISVDLAESYMRTYGDFDIAANSFNDGLFGDTIFELKDCIAKRLAIRSIRDVPACRYLTAYDIYYQIRFARWLLIPSLNERAGLSINLTQADIGNDATPYLNPNEFGSRIHIIQSGKPVPFIDRLD